MSRLEIRLIRDAMLLLKVRQFSLTFNALFIKKYITNRVDLVKGKVTTVMMRAIS